MEKEKKQGNRIGIRTLLGVLQSILIIFLIILVTLMMVQINRLQGTARVINYAGLVRGATQRLVKLEIVEEPNDELVVYLDEILEDLRYGEGDFRLVKLDNDNYQLRLENLFLVWENLKEQILEVRESGYDAAEIDELVEMSEDYFVLADKTVSVAEEYSERIAGRIRLLEVVSAVNMTVLLILIVEQSISVMRIRRRNVVLAKKAYIDIQTGLQNKNRCLEIIENKSVVKESVVFLVFDINNLKLTNDTYGHLVGDKLITNFARILRSVLREEDFAGRCGGDEFIVVLYHVEKDTVENILRRLKAEVDHFNEQKKNIPISYAYGYAESGDFKKCTFHKLFDEADRSMYRNKQKMKKESL